uniref:Retrovirus-related Env polyprotein from transposon gypsy n=1 Tax=Ceratitis capitata TaxID=7213 RepID=W8BB77_CERCA
MSRIKVLQNRDKLYFIIKYPIPKTVNECGSKTHAVKCEKSTFATFCKMLKTITCGQQLIAGETASCSTTANHERGINEIDDGIIIINNDTTVIKGETGTLRIVKGTYLLTFEQQVTINGTEFRNRKNATNATRGQFKKTVVFVAAVTTIAAFLVIWLILSIQGKRSAKKMMDRAIRKITERILDDPHLGGEELTQSNVP